MNEFRLKETETLLNEDPNGTFLPLPSGTPVAGDAAIYNGTTWALESVSATPNAPYVVTANHQMAAGDSLVIAAAACTVTLPAAPLYGVPYGVMASIATVVTVAPGAGVLHGIQSLTRQYEIIWYVFDGTNWYSVPISRPNAATIDFQVADTPTAVLNTATTAASYNAAYHRGVIRYNTSAALNDGAYWASPIPLGLGNWVLTFQYVADSSYGIMTLDYSVDSGTTWNSIGTVDGYNGSSLAVEESFTISNQQASGTAWFRVRVLSKNASSSGYYFAVSSAVLVPAA